MEQSKTFGNRIRILRKKHNLTQLELAKKVEIPKSTLAGYENGLRRPKFETVEKLAEVLHTSSDYLIGITNESQPFKPTKDLRKLLKADDYHIDGKKLSNDDLDFVIQFLEKLSKNDSNNDIELSNELAAETLKNCDK